MNKNFEKRKEDLFNQLAEKYKGKPQKWWHGTSITYLSTGTAGSQSKISKYDKGPIFIKNNIGYYTLVAAFFLFVTGVCFFPFGKNIHTPNSPVTGTVFLCGAIYSLVKIFSAHTRIIISPEGIWFDLNATFIPWNNIIASFIEAVNSESDAYYLILHYFEPLSDEFKEIKYRLDNVGIKYQDLSLYIEYWKFKAEKK